MMEYNDSFEMYISFTYELLKSITCDFSKKSALEERKQLAIEFTKLAIKELKKRIMFIRNRGIKAVSYYGTSASLKTKIKKLTHLQRVIKDFVPHKQDGRYFKDEFPNGYIGLLKAFGLKE